MPPLLSATNISKAYHNHIALDDVSFEIPENSIYGLLGPNGAGKTTLIRILTRIIREDKGSIFFDGKPLDENLLQMIGYMPEERGLYKKMEVGEQVLYLAQLKGLSKSEAVKRSKYWFEKFELQSWWKKKLEELSKGMQQKVQFIVAVMSEPRFLILDEPFTGFDPVNANLIKNELLELRKKGLTIMLSTHRMESVEELCSHIALINHSKKIIEGSVKEIKKKYNTNIYEISFTGSKISFSNALWTAYEIIDTKEDDGMNICRIKMLGNSTPNDLLSALIPNVSVHSFKEIIPGMNDIFISLVNQKVDN
jgi:ABC-2 type transport system ATP-binding protein